MGLILPTIHEYAHVNLVPNLLSHAGKESGETRIQFCFHVARSGCGQSDYRMVPCHRHVWKKIAIVIWRSLIACLLKKKYVWVCLKLWQGGKLSCAYTNYYASMKRAIMRASQLSCTFNGNQNWMCVSSDSFLCVLDMDYAHVLCILGLLAFSVCN